ncbi:MAG TPA: transketolase [Thermomicrobiales bacterium]|nr:transketolase [Thermomicrobiales bacterium]
MSVSTSQWQDIARQLRVDSIRTSTAAKSGHPTSAMSAADIMTVLMTKYLRYDFEHPDNPNNDHLIFSKGHASSLLYAMYRAAGVVTDEVLMSYRKLGSRLQGHPTPVIPWVDVATGSLGQGLPIGVGVALAAKYLDKLPYAVWVLCGDSEMAEGSIWEAFDKASHYKLDNLVVIIDMNRLGQRGETAHGWNSSVYAERARAFGWHAIEIDGHDFGQIDRALGQARDNRGGPVVIVAKTMKGRGVSFMEDRPGFHGKALDAEQARQAIEELGGESSITFDVQEPPAVSPATNGNSGALALPSYELGTTIATRQAYGDALKALGAARPDVVVIDAEVSNSTMSEVFKNEFPERFFEMFIAEQQMVAAAIGFSVRGYVPFASTFGAFMTRAHDFIRMAAISRASIRLCGSHAGVSIGEDGPSQMALEDLAMMRAVHDSTVLYPCDGNQTARLVAAMAEQSGISYLRTTRGATPVIYGPDETFPIGGCKVVRESADDHATIIAAGITLHEALKAADTLASKGINVRVIDLYSVKPVDYQTVHDALLATGGRLVVVEDHWPQGGIGSAILECFATHSASPRDEGADFRMTHLAPSELPGSGTPAELLDQAGISARHIANAVTNLVSG